jgi:hypothetical protein
MTPRFARPAAALLVAMATGAASAQVVPTTRPASLLEIAQHKEHDDAAKLSAALPGLPPAPLADVVQLGRDGDHLRVLTRLAPFDGQCRITIPELPGLCAVNVTLLRPPATQPAMPDLFNLEWSRFDQPGAVVTNITVGVLPANVQLVRYDEMFDHGDTQVQLTEQRNPSRRVGAEPGIRLQVTHQGGWGRPAGANVEVTAASFGALCRLHPAEVARYVEPILRDLHADAAVLPPDATLAYQVFATDVSVDPTTKARVAELVKRLDADDFRDRDAAGAALLQLGPVAAVAVGQVDPATLSPEQRSRAAAVLRHARPASADDARRLGTDVDFLLNCLLVPDPFVTRVALARLGAVAGHAVAFDATLAGQARRDAVWRLRGTLAVRTATTRSH